MQFRLLAALAAGAMVLGGAQAASALTYTSYLEYRDGLSGPQTPYGTVTIEELDPNSVRVTVSLADPDSLFVNTGGPHDPFLFNLAAPSSVTVSNTGAQDFFYAGDGSYQATPYGTFIDKVGCCQVWVPAKKKTPGHWEDGNGASKGKQGDLVFTVYNAGGLTFAGAGAKIDPITGKLTGLGTGNQFSSNLGGWWFAADIYDGKTGLTYNVAARDAYGPIVPTAAIPEPATWALMIVGFAGAGALLRRRRAALA